MDQAVPPSIAVAAVEALQRIATALEALAPRPAASPDLTAADAFMWRAETASLQPVASVSRVPLDLLCGIDHVRTILVDNTRRFAHGLPANNVLLWGARGMGKSSLIKAAHAHLNETAAGGEPLKLIEINREDIDSLPRLMAVLRDDPHRFLVFCDDLSPSLGARPSLQKE